MKDDEKQKKQQEPFKARFQPSASQLKEITERGAELLANMTEEELGEFAEDVESENGQKRTMDEMKILLFLDFDGVVHRRTGNVFDLECLSHIERVLNDFPTVKVIVASSWREHYSLDQLKQLLGKTIADKVIDETPLITGTYDQHVRYLEALKYLTDSGQQNVPWVALDDTPELYSADAPVICVDGLTGMTEREAEQLRIAFRVLMYHGDDANSL